MLFRILERIVHDQLYDILDGNISDLYHRLLVGKYRPQKTEFDHFCRSKKAFNTVDHRIVVEKLMAYDIRGKAFDTVDHRIVVEKLMAYGIRGKAFETVDAFCIECFL